MTGRSPLAVGVDIGGTKVAAAVVDAAGRVLRHEQRRTPATSPDSIRDVVVDLVGELSRTHRVEAVGVGAAGWIDAGRSVVRYAPNLAWRDEPLQDLLSAALDLPVVVENDANAAAWAEFRFGAARQATESMVLLTVGTGIGGGIVVGGELVRGAHGMAGEIGHTRVVPDGLPCGCGRQGCLEQYASGTALVRLAREAVAQQPEPSGVLVELAGGDPARIDGPMVTRAARAGDAAARYAFDQVGHWLGAGLADVVAVLDPELLVLGGGVMAAGELLLAPVREAYRQALARRGQFPVAPVTAASLGPLAGVIGAADLVRRR